MSWSSFFVVAGFELSACILVVLVGLANDFAPLHEAEAFGIDTFEEENGESNLWSTDAPPDENLYENLDRLDIWDERLRKKREREEEKESREWDTWIKKIAFCTPE